MFSTTQPLTYYLLHLLRMGVFFAIIVVVLFFIFACSFNNFLNQLPNCKEDTRAAIDATIVELGYFINFKRNVNMLRNKIPEFIKHIEELQSKDPDYVPLPSWLVSVREDSVQVMYEAGKMMNSPWYRMWTRTCYELSYRVADMLLTIEFTLNPEAASFSHPSRRERIPGTVVVFLITYSLTNAALLPLLNSTIATIGEIVFLFKLKKNLQILERKIHRVEALIDEYKGKQTWMGAFVTRNVGLIEEGKRLLNEEAGDMISHLCKGWINGSRYRLCKRVEALISKLNKIWSEVPQETVRPYNEIDWIVIEMGYSLKLEKHLEMLRNILDRLVTTIEDRKGNVNESIVDALRKGNWLRQDVEDMMDQWDKGWTGSRSIFSKTIRDFVASVNRQLEGMKAGPGARFLMSRIDGLRNVLPAAVTDIRQYLLDFKTNIEALHTKIQQLEESKDKLERMIPPHHPRYQEAQKMLVIIEATKQDGVQLLMKAQAMDQSRYKYWTGSRYRLSKTLVKLMDLIDRHTLYLANNYSI